MDQNGHSVAREHYRESVADLSPLRDEDDAITIDEPLDHNTTETRETSCLFEGGNDDIEAGRNNEEAALNSSAAGGPDEDASGESKIDPDPFKYIKREHFINEERSGLGNCIGWLDFIDRFYSRKLSLVDSPIPNFVLCSFGWLFNRKQCLL